MPVLVFHSTDDTLIDYSNAEHTVASIPGAELVTFTTGGHFLVGNFAEGQAKMGVFLGE